MAASSLNNVSINNSGWLGGDPETGHNGDVGNYAHIANSTTQSQASAAASVGPQETFTTTGLADANQAKAGSMAGLKAAIQSNYNQAEWFQNNINFGNTSTESVSVGMTQIVDNTTQSAALCIAGVSGVALLAATTPESAGTTVLAATFAFGVSTLVGVTNDCYEAASSWGSDIGAALQAAIYGVTGATSAMGHDFMMAFGGNSVGLGGTAGGLTMTPGFHPSMAYISSIASHLTAAAQQEYLGHT